MYIHDFDKLGFFLTTTCPIFKGFNDTSRTDIVSIYVLVVLTQNFQLSNNMKKHS